jgi:transposase
MKMTEAQRQEIRSRYEAIRWTLNERMHRLWAATEAKVLGHGGVTALSEITGLSRIVIQRGIKELEEQAFPDPESGAGRIRRSGAGPKPLTEKSPKLLLDLESLVEPETRGDPMSPLRWTTKSLRTLAEELRGMGYEISHTTVGELLHGLGYSLQANDKVLAGQADHPDRDAQFSFINAQAEKAMDDGNPVLSVDTKKKELIGNYKNAGQTWEPKGSPVKVQDHDFPDEALGKVAPYGIYDLQKNEGWVNVGTDHDTGTFAVESLRRWWNMQGQKSYPHCQEIVVTADGGGSNGWRSRLWKQELQMLADEIGRTIRVSHFPPGTSKWNKIEHRLFSHISMNWKGIPLTSHEVVVNLIANTRTSKGLVVHAVLDENKYPKGIKITDDQMDALNIDRNTFHGEWNYAISPRSNPVNR